MTLDIYMREILCQKKKRSQNVKNWEWANINLQNTKAREPQKRIDNETRIR